MKEDFTDVLDFWFDSRLDNIHTILPGRIETYYGHSERKAKVQPLINPINVKNKKIELKPIDDVPVIFPGSSNFNMIYPLKKGDGVLLVFSEGSLGNFVNSQDEITDCLSASKFNLNDCIAIPGLWSFKSLPDAPENENDLFIQYQDSFIQIKKDTGEIIIEDKNGNKVETSSTGIGIEDSNGNKIAIDSTLLDLSNSISDMKTELENLWSAIISINTNLQSFVSTNCVVGAPVTPNPATIALFVADNVQANIYKSLLGSLLK